MKVQFKTLKQLRATPDIIILDHGIRHKIKDTFCNNEMIRDYCGKEITIATYANDTYIGSEIDNGWQIADWMLDLELKEGNQYLLDLEGNNEGKI